MSIVETFAFESMVGDVDDHRPNTRWALVVDDAQPPSRVDSFAVIVEEIAPGDRIPLHVHGVDELILYREGEAIVTLGEERRMVGAGAIEFIPAGTPHGTENATDASVLITAVFPATRVDVRYLDRNPAPGTEGNDPQPPIVFDLRTGEVSPA
jgi:quercetin dioxygenase-like cupin family protein